MSYARALIALIILTFIIMPLVMPVTPSTGNVPTPTQELTNQQYAVVGNLLRNVRVCPDTACTYQYALLAKSSFWFCWQVDPVIADGFTWVMLPDGNWASISFGTRQYVFIQQRYRIGEGCNG